MKKPTTESQAIKIIDNFDCLEPSFYANILANLARAHNLPTPTEYQEILELEQETKTCNLDDNAKIAIERAKTDLLKTKRSMSPPMDIPKNSKDQKFKPIIFSGNLSGNCCTFNEVVEDYFFNSETGAEKIIRKQLKLTEKKNLPIPL